MAYVSGSRHEQAALEALLPQLEAEGFTVFLQPPDSMLPELLHRSYRPDAIALKTGKKLAIEVVSGADHKGKVERLREVFAKQPDWELRVVYAPLRITVQQLDVIPREKIEHLLRQLPSVSGELGAVAGILVAWSLFEAAARALVPEGLSRPQAPSQMIELLASEGSITPDEAAQLRRIADLRTQAAHGAIDVVISSADIESISRIIEMLLEQQDPVPVKA